MRIVTVPDDSPPVKLPRGLFESARDAALDLAAEHGEFFASTSDEAERCTADLRRHWLKARSVARGRGSRMFYAWVRVTDGQREAHLYVTAFDDGNVEAEYAENRGCGGFSVVIDGDVSPAVLPAPKNYFWPGCSPGEAGSDLTVARYRARW